MATLTEQLQIGASHLTETGFESSMAMNDFHAQPLGFLSGGATLAFAEVVCGMMSNELLGEGYFAFGQNVSAQHVRPTKAQGLLHAKGTLVHKGRTSHVWDVIMTDDEGKTISHITVTCAIVAL